MALHTLPLKPGLPLPVGHSNTPPSHWKHQQRNDYFWRVRSYPARRPSTEGFPSRRGRWITRMRLTAGTPNASRACLLASGAIRRGWRGASTRHVTRRFPQHGAWTASICACQKRKIYARRLRALLRQATLGPTGDVALNFVCFGRPILPPRWPQLSRPTSDPIREFHTTGHLRAPGDDVARDSAYALFRVSGVASLGDPGRFICE
jgi:hypothetical protein